MGIANIFKKGWERQVNSGEVIEKSDGTFVYSNELFQKVLESEGIEYNENIKDYIISDESIVLKFLDGTQKELDLQTE